MRCGKACDRRILWPHATGGLKGRCRQCERIASRDFEKNNKDKRRARDTKRAAATGGTRGSFDIGVKRELHRKQGGRCICCLRLIEITDTAEVDHGHPLSRGGADHSSNLFLVHARCNKEKHNKTLPEHRAWRVKVGKDPENIGEKHGLIR